MHIRIWLLKEKKGKVNGKVAAVMRDAMAAKMMHLCRLTSSY